MDTLSIVNWEELTTRLRERLANAPHGTKGQLAKDLGVTPTHLSLLISGDREITRQMAEKIAALYGIQLDYVAKGGEL